MEGAVMKILYILQINKHFARSKICSHFQVFTKEANLLKF